MTSSSAINVLLKSPVQAAAVPKRDNLHESSTTDFQDAFKRAQDTSVREKDLRVKDAHSKDARAKDVRAKDVQDSARRQDEKLAKANSDKAADAADNRKQAASSPEKTSREKNTQENQAASVGKAEQSDASEQECAKDKSVANKNTGNKAAKKTDDTAATEGAANVNVDAITTNIPALPTDTVLTAALTISSLNANADESSLTTDIVLDGTQGNDISSEQNQDDVDSLAITPAQVSEQSDTGLKSAVDSALAQTTSQATQAGVAVSATEQESAAPVSEIPEQTPQILPVVTATNSAVTNAPVVVAEIDPANVVADVLDEQKSSNKTFTVDSNSTVDAELETTPTSAQTEDAKSSFEKMLQTVARSNSPVKDESVPANIPTNTSNANSSTNSNALDSVFRLNDAQTPAARSFVVQTAVPVPVGQPQWSEAVGEKVLWLAAQNVQSAEINLHPKDLGPIQVKVSVNQEQASVSFTSHHAVVREVLDQNLNRLRDMFNEQGLNLVNVDVSDKSFSRQQGEGKEQKGQGANAAIEDETPVAVSAIVQQRLVDHYA